MADREAVRCPGCGERMRFCSEPPGDGGRYVCYCGWRSPWVETQEYARSAAMRRVQEPNRRDDNG